MKIFAVYDTNILVSALLSKRTDSAVVLTMEALLQKEVTPLYNHEILNEYKEVLAREKFHFPKELIDKIIHQIEKDGVSSERVKSEEEFSDSDDAVFYEVALSKEGSFLVTGNAKHFPKTPIVVSPSEFLVILRKNKLNV